MITTSSFFRASQAMVSAVQLTFQKKCATGKVREENPFDKINFNLISFVNTLPLSWFAERGPERERDPEVIGLAGRWESHHVINLTSVREPIKVVVISDGRVWVWVKKPIRDKVQTLNQKPKVKWYSQRPRPETVLFGFSFFCLSVFLSVCMYVSVCLCLSLCFRASETRVLLRRNHWEKLPVICFEEIKEPSSWLVYIANWVYKVLT